MTRPSDLAPPGTQQGPPDTQRAAGAGRPRSPTRAPRPSEQGRQGARSPRLWSARRIPAAVVALVALCGFGLMLYDVIAVRAGHRAGAWRTHLADEMAGRPVDDLWMLVGSAVAAAVGLWLLFLALTPGLRRLLPLRAPDGSTGLRAWLDRRAAELMLRDAAMRVPGVGRAKVRVGRHRVVVFADARFRDPSTVRDDLNEAVHDQCRQLALAHAPRVAIRVRERVR